MIRIPGIRGYTDTHGNVTLSYNPHNTGKLVSHQGVKHALVCDLCADVYWVDLKIVSFTCPRCAERLNQG